MFISEDGTITGSVDVSKLDQLKPKSDEAKAQVEALKAEVKAGQEQVARNEERLAEQHRTQNAALYERSAFNQDDSGGGKSQAEADKQSDAEQAEVERLQAEAEKAGVTVDKRWGADRLRQEIASAQSAKKKG